MSRRHRPVLWGLVAAASTTAAGLSVNITTDQQGSLAAWLAVAACTALAGIVPALFADAPQPALEIPRERLLIECTIGPDGTTTIKVDGQGDETTRMLAHRLPGALGRPDVTLPRPVPVALVTRSQATGIARRLIDLDERCRGLNQLDLRLCIDNRAEPRREAMRRASVVIIDDRCSLDGIDLLVGGINLAALGRLRALAVVLSCHDGADVTHTEALRRSLGQPVAYLGCAGPVRSDHLGVLYPLLLEGIGELAGGQATVDELCYTMSGALTKAQQNRPQLDWNRWSTAVLHPIALENQPADSHPEGHDRVPAQANRGLRR